MRTYTGTRHPGGRVEVTVTERLDRPTVEEIADLTTSLRQHLETTTTAEAWDAARPEREAFLARKQALLGRIEAAATPRRRPLRHIEVASADGFEWGYAGAGPTDLAHALLTDHIGVEPTTAVRNQFRDDVVASLPRDGFSLGADAVAEWVVANRDLVDEELFLKPTSPAFAVTTEQSAEIASDPAADPTASVLVAACESAWADIRAHHPELPDAVIVLGTGVEKGRLVKLGHWWGGQWLADGKARGEVLLAGEALHLPPAQVFEVLLHEAAHGINTARGVRDTSRYGRYHNKEFAKTAREVLLMVRPMPPYGLADTSLTPAAHDRYGATIERLGEAMRIARHLGNDVRLGGRDEAEVEAEQGSGASGGGSGQEREGKTGGWQATTCGCGRKMRMAKATLSAGPVVCGVCGTEFTTTQQRDRSEATVDTSFVDRRRAALESEATDTELAKRWHRAFGTPEEAPMPAADNDELRRRSALARNLLKADGTLRGPTATTPAGDLQSGDRVYAVEQVDDLPAGTLGTVTSVTPHDGVEIDFATWGRVRAGLADAITSHIAHDYARLERTPAVESPELER